MARLPEVDPAVASLALWCVYRDGQSATHTAGETIYLGPEFPLLPISEQTGLLAHHVLHVALRHSARRFAAHQRYGPQFQAELYDLACDALVNEALLQGGHALPRPAVRAVDLVTRLPHKARPENVLADWDSDQLYLALAELSPGQSGGDPGSVAQYAAAQGFTPDLKESPDAQAEPEIWSERVKQALTAGARAGSGIGPILTRFGDLPSTQTPWEVLLRRILSKALAHTPRQSHRRPDRAWLARDALARQTGGPHPVFEPGRARDGTRPRLVICLDTSSSVPQSMLRLFAAEASAIVRRSGAETHLLGFDTEVHTRIRFDRAEAIQSLNLRRDGGTDLGPVLATAQGYDPSMIVVLTDLDAPVPEQPGCEVLWVVPAKPPVVPDFGKVLMINDTFAAPNATNVMHNA